MAAAQRLLHFFLFFLHFFAPFDLHVSKPVSEYRAAITSAICSTVPHAAGILLAGSLDGTVKVWR